MSGTRKSLFTLKQAVLKAETKLSKDPDHAASLALKSKLQNGADDLNKMIEDYEQKLLGEYDWTHRDLAQIKTDTNSNVKKVNDYMTAIRVYGN